MYDLAFFFFFFSRGSENKILNSLLGDWEACSFFFFFFFPSFFVTGGCMIELAKRIIGVGGVCDVIYNSPNQTITIKMSTSWSEAFDHLLCLVPSKELLMFCILLRRNGSIHNDKWNTYSVPSHNRTISTYIYHNQAFNNKRSAGHVYSMKGSVSTTSVFLPATTGSLHGFAKTLHAQISHQEKNRKLFPL